MSKFIPIEVGGVIRDVNFVADLYGFYRSDINGLFYVTDWNGKPRAALATDDLAATWCRHAMDAFNGLPHSSDDIRKFNAAMSDRQWRVTALLGDCQVWGLFELRRNHEPVLTTEEVRT